MKQGERTQKIAKYVWASHARKERVITNVTDSRECHSGIVFTICTNQFHLPENGREGLKLVSNMAWKKWNTNFCWDILSGKSGLSFQMYRCSWKFSAGTTKKVMFCFLSNRIFRNLFVNGKQSSFRGETSGGVFKGRLFNISGYNFYREITNIPVNFIWESPSEIGHRFEKKS